MAIGYWAIIFVNFIFIGLRIRIVSMKKTRNVIEGRLEGSQETRAGGKLNGRQL